MINPDDLNVQSFQTTDSTEISPIGYCCTGCTSGCGLNPTAGYCESKSGDLVCPVDTIAVE